MRQILRSPRRDSGAQLVERYPSLFGPEASDPAQLRVEWNRFVDELLREGAERDRRRLRVLRGTVRGLGVALLAVGGLMLVGQWSAPALLSWAMLEAMMLGASLGFAHVLWRDSYWTRVARRDEAVSRPE